MALLVNEEQEMAFVLVVVFQCFVYHLCGAASLPTSVLLPGTMACDAKNPDPCSNFPGLCTTGGGLCVYKGPCEYECVCPPDGRRGRDCTGGDDARSVQGEEESESSKRGSLINSLLVFPQDLFWDSHQVLRPEESVKMMQSTPANDLKPKTDATPSTTRLPETSSSTAATTSKPGEQSSVHYITTLSSVTRTTPPIYKYTLGRNDKHEDGNVYSKNMDEITTRIQTTSSSLLSTSTLLSNLTTVINLQNATVSSTPLRNTTSSMELKEDGGDEGVRSTSGNTASKSEKDEDTKDNATVTTPRKTAATTTTTTPTTTATETTTTTMVNNSQIVNATTTITDTAWDQPLVSTPRPGVVSPSSKPTFTVSGSKDDENSTATVIAVNPTNSVTEPTTTPSLDSTPFRIITTILQTTLSPASFTKGESTTISNALSTAQLPSFPTQPNIPERFPGHETFPTFFRDVFDDANKEGEIRNAEMSKRVQRVFFPLPGFEKLRRKED